jgi:hypothetical protein
VAGEVMPLEMNGCLLVAHHWLPSVALVGGEGTTGSIPPMRPYHRIKRKLKYTPRRVKSWFSEQAVLY